MKTHTSQFKEEIKKFGRQLDSKITYTQGNQVIELGKEQLNSITPHYEGGILKSVMKQLDIDSNVEIPEGTILNYKFGVLVNNTYEYVDYGNYVVYKVEKQEDTRSYKITCYDKMLYSMIPYEAMPITYPITIRNYLSAICTKLGLTFKNASDTFTNYDKQIASELYLDAEGNSLDYTFRDVLDEIAGATGSTICINEYTDELEVRYIDVEGTTTTIDGTAQLTDVDFTKDVEITNIEGNTTPSTPQAVNVVSGEQDILVCGRNISPTNINDWESGQYSNVDGSKGVYSSRIRLKGLTPVNPSTTYYLNTYATDTNYKFIVRTYDKTGTFVRSIGTVNNNSTITTRNTEYYLGITMYNSASSSITFDTFKGLFESEDIKPFICLNSETDKTYEAYNGTTYGINLGKNLFNKNNAPLLNMHIGSSTFANNARAKLTYIYIQPNTTYTVSKILSSRFYIATSTAIPSNGLTYTTGKANNNATQLTITSGANDQYLAVYFYNGDYDTLTPQEILDTLQIEKGSVATTYTPYKTPIELCKIVNYQDFIKKGTGKNLFDTSKFIQGTWQNSSSSNRIVGFLIPTKTGQKYRVTLRNNELDFAIGNTTKNEQSGNTQVQSDSGWKSADYTYTITGNGYLFLQVKKRYGGNLTPSDLSATDFQVELGETASSFEPYGMKDKWYIEKNIGKVVLNGSETGWGKSGSTDCDRFYVPILDLNTLNTSYGLSNYYKYNVNLSTTLYEFKYEHNSASSKDRVFINHSAYGTTTLQQYKTWLSNNNVSLYYVLDTPTYTEITDTELINQLNAIDLLNGLNNISITSADLTGKITIHYNYKAIDTIDEEYLKDVNVNFGEKYGPVNSIVLSRSAESDNIYLRDEESVLANGLCEIKIKDNQIMNNNNRSDFLQGLLDALDGLEYYINDFTSTGITYYNLCDRYNVKIDNKTYSCVMFNDEVNITQGLEEQVYTEMPEESETDYSKSDKTDRKINQAYIIVDKQNQEINSVVQNINTLSQMIDNQGNQIDALGTRITQNVENITASITGIQETLEDGVSKVKTTSVTIDNSGLNVSTDTSKITTTLTNNSFEIKDSGDNTLAFFGYDENEGISKAEMDNLTVTNYFVAGNHRVEDYPENSEHRTGWFYIGG